MHVHSLQLTRVQSSNSACVNHMTVTHSVPTSSGSVQRRSEEVGHGHVNRARMRRGLHTRALTSSGHCLVLLSCDLRVLQNFAGS